MLALVQDVNIDGRAATGSSHHRVKVGEDPRGVMDLSLELVFGVDTEEEGLFVGTYPRTPPGVRNVAELRRLEFVTRELGLPLTLLVSYHVARDPACRDLLRRWKDELGAEIGAHLHPWNTPPFADLPGPEPVPSDRMPAELLRAKLQTLLGAIEDNLGVRPRAFRMGRWDLGGQVRRLLPEHGIRVDSSVVPCRHEVGGPDNFLAPGDPHWLDVPEGTPKLLEVPLTLVPLLDGAPRVVHRFSRRMAARRGERLLSGFRSWGAVGPQPVWYVPAAMRLAARLHAARGGRVLSLSVHSSELMPGGSPNSRDEAAVARLVARTRRFLAWIVGRYAVEGRTLSTVTPPPEPRCAA